MIAFLFIGEAILKLFGIDVESFAIAGAGSLTTILSLKAAYGQTNILIGIVVNLIFVFIVLKSSVWLEKKLGQGGFSILRKVFGIILLSLAIKLLKDNLLPQRETLAREGMV